MKIDYDSFEQALVSCGSSGAILVTSIDDLYATSRTHGLRALEAVRFEFKERLLELKRSIDSLYMLTDDLACLLIRELDHPDHALLAASKFERVFDPRSNCKDETLGKDLNINASAGIVYFSQCPDISTADMIYRHAEHARLSACQNRKLCEVEVFAEDASPAIENTSAAHFDQALEDADLSLDYQPQYRLSDGELIGAEALIRWRTESLFLAPDQFLPYISNEQHWALFQYVFRLVIRNQQLCGPKVPIAINLDPVVLAHPELVSFIEKDSLLWGVNPATISFEVTESATVENFEAATQTLNRLQEMGYSTSIDDFGSQHSSFEHLRNLPAQEVKIDRQFITNIVDKPYDQALVKGVIDLCHQSGKIVVAEGIEDAETVNMLIELGCDIGQGYYLGRPLPFDQYAQLSV